MVHFVYILKCSDESYYTGITWNLKKRYAEHRDGLCLYTKNKKPLQLVFFCGFPNKILAARFEQYLKSNSGKAFRNKHLLKNL